MSESSKLHLLSVDLNITEDDVNQFVSLFAYAGFNPEMVHEHFSKVCKDASISESQFMSDLKTIIVLGAMKGNYTVKNSSKISDGGKSVADGLYVKYKMKKGSVGNEKKAITLPRVLSAFPEITARIVLRCPDKNFGSRTSGLSRLIKSPVFAAIVPQTLHPDVKKFFLDLYNVYSADQTLTISKINSFSEAYDRQQQFTEVAHASSVPSEATRIKLFTASRSLLEKDISAASGIKELKSHITVQQFDDALGALSSDT